MREAGRETQRVLAGLALALLMSAGAMAQGSVPAGAGPAWVQRLQDELSAVETRQGVRLGAVVRDLDGGATASYRGDQRWYLASMVKVPVAIAVLRGVERGQYTLDTPLTVRASDFVDGAGSTNAQPVGTALPLRALLEQMIVHSDNTASDMLIDLVGIAEVNAVVRSLVPEGFERITPLGEVRRLVYGKLVPNVDRLGGPDLVLLHSARSDTERVRLLRQLVDAPEGRAGARSLDAAYDSYYAGGLNSARLDAYADLLGRLADGKALGPAMTEYLLALMERVATGTHRLRAGLPPSVRLAHKTGTQRRRVCDAGLVRWADAGRERRVLVVACTRDAPTLERAEAALMQVALAVCRSGLQLPAIPAHQGAPDATSCPAPHTPPGHGPDAQPPPSRR